MQDYASRQRQPQRHALGMALVVVLHLLLFWAIQSGLSRSVIQKAQVVVDVLLLAQDRPKPPEAPPAPAAPPKPQRVSPTPPVPVPVPAPVVPTPWPRLPLPAPAGKLKCVFAWPTS